LLYRCRQNTIEIGKRLIAAKELVGHGNFGKWLEDNFNLSQSTAQRFIKCAENFENTAAPRCLKPSQMFEMLVLTPEEVEKFIAEKTAEGKPVEDMTVKQLRAEVAEYKAELAKKNSEVKEFSFTFKGVSVLDYRKFKVTSRRYGDVDNHGKAILDAMNKIVYVDDSQIVKCEVEKFTDKNQRIEISVTETEDTITNANKKVENG
jgi:Holliday junction resolvase RusA-like endonuclease